MKKNNIKDTIIKILKKRIILMDSLKNLVGEQKRIVNSLKQLDSDLGNLEKQGE
ncbi:MAG: hypothetical protein AABX54_03945 [Nanoarchaeota archaeon]